MKHGMSKFMDKRKPTAFKIQITSMVDMFVLLLIFLLMNYSADPIVITAGKDVTLPESNTMEAINDAEKTVKLVVGKTGIYIDEERIIEFKDGRLPASAVDSADPQNLPELFNALDKLAAAAKTETTDPKTNMKVTAPVDNDNFDGRVLMQADREMPYDLLKKVMYTSMMAGFSDVRLAVLGQ